MASAVAAPAVGSVHSLKSLSLSGGSAGAISYGPSSAFLGTALKRSSGSVACFSSKPLVVSASSEEEVKKAKKKDRWGGLAYDTSDDQQDITRGKGMVDSLYQGAVGMGTQTVVMSSYEYLSQGQRFLGLDNIKDGYYIAPAFMDKIVVHIAKNFMSLPNIKIPLILGIWGGKGQGKSFQCELVFSKLGINPIMMSAGELESGNAGEPAKLIRQRYREAADIIKKKGQMCVLFINDLDAGAGRMGGTTQYTVNNQMVNATLMNIADNPTNVQLPGIYNKEDLPRVPIVVTGNDFSTLYAPLIRDGRMEKFYWAPTREDRIGVCQGIFRVDDVPATDIVKLVDTFPGQSIDFFGALRARVYDDEVRKWVVNTGVDKIGKKLVNSKEGPPSFEKPAMTVDKLLEYGHMLVQEQDNVNRVQLAEKYLGHAALGGANDDAISQGTFYGPGAGPGVQSAQAAASDQFSRLVGRTAGSGTPAADKTPAGSSSSSSDHVSTDESVAAAVKFPEVRPPGVKEKTQAAEEVGEQQQQQVNMAEMHKASVAKPLNEADAKTSGNAVGVKVPEVSLTGVKEKTEAAEEVVEQQQEVVAEMPKASVAKPLNEPEAKPSGDVVNDPVRGLFSLIWAILRGFFSVLRSLLRL